MTDRHAAPEPVPSWPACMPTASCSKARCGNRKALWAACLKAVLRCAMGKYTPASRAPRSSTLTRTSSSIRAIHSAWAFGDECSAMTALIYDVVVVGAGIVGAACAEECARQGMRVAIIDRDVIGGGATAAGMGHIVVMDDSEAQFALTRYSQQLWQQLRPEPVSYTHLRAHETPEHLVCRL